MKFSVKIIIAIVIATLTAIAYSMLLGAGMPALILWFAFTVATVLTTIAVQWTPPVAAPAAAQPKAKAPATAKKKPTARKPAAKPAAAAVSSSASGERTTGTVKWFNGSKGFGFVVKDDGEEIFVHFRSIRGEGRRSLRDGQSVSFVVTQSDKGPQAEDVEALD